MKFWVVFVCVRRSSALKGVFVFVFKKSEENWEHMVTRWGRSHIAWGRRRYALGPPAIWGRRCYGPGLTLVFDLFKEKLFLTLFTKYFYSDDDMR